MSTTWLKSSYSGGQGGNCVEWAPQLAASGNVPVRDSKDTSRASLSFPTAAWSAFVSGLKHAER
ncbi:DUF397 domain-containing protein [Streptomyces qinglanensis]|uniref:DUF397 domain-containing protein n=1 Tax=Streptomyces qinglanensis TaxID=943816 RepID=A0A1H9UWB5_9ACTN|nr:DUF397 domain-containing protein [Streptomyces qinglanensis]SES13755.1 protein of unknown function [Streptomyces qinglanensis]